MKRCSTFISEGTGMFELRDASAGYKETVIVHHASLRVESGEIVALLGRNGVGKTTLMRYAMGLCRQVAGADAAGGGELPDLRPADRA